MNSMKKAAAGAVVGGAVIAAGGMGLAHAAPPTPSVNGDGKVNVTVTAGGQQIGVLQDVSLASAEALATAACPNAGITSEALQALDTNNTAVPGVCTGADANLTFSFVQNTPGNSSTAPGQNKTSTTPTSTTTTTTTTTTSH